MSEGQIPVIIVGAGQAGLATSRELTKAGVEHVVLERDRIGETWRGRWDSFCLVTPNWSVQLPDGHYDGPDPDGFMPRDEIVSYLERYAAGAPVQENVSVDSIEALDGGFVLDTSSGELRARSVVLATGAYQRPHRPAAADTLPADLFQIDVDEYRNEQALPAGRVLVIGSGQSGCQIAEELHEAGRDVGRRLRAGGVGAAPVRGARPRLVAGGDGPCRGSSRIAAGPRSAALRKHRRHRSRRRSRPPPAHVAGAGSRPRSATFSARRTAGRSSHPISPRPSPCATSGTDSSWTSCADSWPSGVWKILASSDPEPFAADAPEDLELSGFGAVVFAGGFRPDYASWLPWPEAFDELGFPIHVDGASTVVPGLYFVGVHFLRKRKSSLLYGVGEDAAVVAGRIAALGR